MTRYASLLVFCSCLLLGCATQPEELIPEKYVNLVSVNKDVLHASMLPKHQNILSALKQRNLVITNDDKILPVSGAACSAKLYYRISLDPNLPSFIGRHNDLLSGFYLEVEDIDGYWSFHNKIYKAVDTYAELETINSFIQPLLNSFDELLVKVVNPDISDSKIKELEGRMRLAFPDHSVRIIYASSVLKPAVKEQMYVVDNDILSTCMRQADFVNAPIIPYQKGNNSLEHLIKSLPNNADFNVLERQKDLMQAGRYLTIEGETLSYANYLQAKENNSCAELKPSDADYVYCTERRHDARNVISDGPYIFRKE